jgi:hypothetical protein
VIFVII